MQISAKMISLGLVLAPAGLALAQSTLNLDIRVAPQALKTNQRGFVVVSGQFPDSCTFGDGQLDFKSNQDDDGRIDVRYVAPEPSQCTETITFARRGFGPLPFETPTGDATELVVNFTLERGESLRGSGSAAFNVVADAPNPQPESGVWWSPALPGHGVGLEVSGSRLFASLFSYQASGRPAWRVTNGALEGAIFSGEWQRFRDGNCLLCGEPFMPNVADGTPVATHWAFDGHAVAWLRFGAQPGEAVRMQRAHVRPAARVEAGEAVETLPDLSGKWLFVITDGQSDATSTSHGRIIEFAEQSTPDASTLLASFIDPSGFFELECRTEESTGRLAGCTFSDCAPCSPRPEFEARSEDVGVNRIEFASWPFMLIRVPPDVSVFVPEDNSPMRRNNP